MRITAQRGDHVVTIEIEGSSKQLLREAKDAALELLGDVKESTPKISFGFSAEGRNGSQEGV